MKGGLLMEYRYFISGMRLADTYDLYHPFNDEYVSDKPITSVLQVRQIQKELCPNGTFIITNFIRFPTEED